MLIYKGMKKTVMMRGAGITSSALARMGKNETVTMETLGKLCEYFKCNIEDIVEYIPDRKDTDKE